MKKNINRLLGVAICIYILATGAAFAQPGKGNAAKRATEVTDDQEKNTVNQQGGRSEETRNKNQRDTPANQQKPGAQQREEAKKRAENNPGKADKARTDDYEDKDNIGNAYGRDKGDMSGREFGQARSADARRTGEQRRKELGKAVDDGDKKVRDANEKIAKEKEKLEKDKKDRKITDADYNEKKAKIERAERAVKALEEKVYAGKQLTITIQD